MGRVTSSESIKPIDIKTIFKSKNPRLARMIPGFIFAYLKRIVHQDFLNEILKNYGDKLDIEFIDASVKYFNIKVVLKGEENIPRTGRYIFAANHPWGGLDGIVLMHIVGKYYKNFRYLVNDLLMNISTIKGLFIPINKHGKQAADAAVMMEEAFQSDMQIITCPAGLVSRRIKGQIIDLEWKKSFIAKAIQYKRDVIPVHMSGRNTNFFYRLANLRKFLGIKSNIEMLYLVDETYKHQNKTIEVSFGKPIPWQTFDKSKDYRSWAKFVKEKAYAMAGIKNIPL